MTRYNFSAGPAVLPKSVLKLVQKELLDYKGTGSSIMEISHRSKEFKACLAESSTQLKKLLSVPSNYQVLFMQGGASLQFSAIVYNLLEDLKRPVDYIITGAWSDKAAKEAARLGANVNVVFSSVSSNHSGEVPDNLEFSEDPVYIYYCENETVHGVEFPSNWVEKLPGNVPIVCDMSSNFMSRPFDVSKYGIIFGGAQKNIGPAGLTVVIVRNDLIGRFSKSPLIGPLMVDYKTCSDNGSMYNTPPCFAIYVAGLVFDWISDLGGLEMVEKMNAEKSGKLYSSLQKYPGHYSFPVKDPKYRSRMNVCFRILKNGIPDEDEEIFFVKAAESNGLVSLAGHRSVGGVRASLYNAQQMEAVDALISFIETWAMNL